MELNENELWYVRSMVHRGMAAVRQSIEDGERYLATDPPATFRESVRGMNAYHRQLLQEAEQYIPEKLR